MSQRKPVLIVMHPMSPRSDRKTDKGFEKMVWASVWVRLLLGLLLLVQCVLSW